MTPHAITNNGCWVVDRKISLGLILAVLVHAVCVVAWLVRTESRVSQLEQADAKHEVLLKEVSTATTDIAVTKADVRWIRDVITNNMLIPEPNRRRTK